jgi:hypothetical protein
MDKWQQFEFKHWFTFDFERDELMNEQPWRRSRPYH